jgi:hypothetical protein
VNAIVDHVFICCSAGGPEAEALTRLGLKEGSANTHPGQGTACRRFFFANAYLELLWVGDPMEARSEAVLPARLWERWSKRGDAACPYGIVFRPADDTTDVRAPFESWSYEPQYVPPGLPMESLTAVTVWRPAGGDSQVARALEAAGLVAFHDADDYLLELRFDDANSGRADLRPALPLTLRW